MVENYNLGKKKLPKIYGTGNYIKEMSRILTYFYFILFIY